jgi:O-antigen/teichoic acid export membrane protein
MLGLFHSAITIGIYTYVYSLLDFIYTFGAASIHMSIYPHMVESYNKGNKSQSNFLVNSMLKYTLILILPATAGFLLLGEEIITLFSGTKYLQAVVLIPFLIIFPLLKLLNTVLSYVLMVRKRTKTIGFIYFVGMIVNLILNFMLIPKYSYFGAAIATSLSYLLLAVLFLTSTKKLISLDYSYIKFDRIIVSTAVMSLAISFINPGILVTKIATIFAGVFVYFTSLFLSKAYVKQELLLIKSFLRSKK